MTDAPLNHRQSDLLYRRLLRGEATSAEYVAALRREARERIDSLRGSLMNRTAESRGQVAGLGLPAPEPRSNHGAEALRRELLALPPRAQAALLGIDGPHDVSLCPICFDDDSTGCLHCGGTGKREAT